MNELIQIAYIIMYTIFGLGALNIAYMYLRDRKTAGRVASLEGHLNNMKKVIKGLQDLEPMAEEDGDMIGNLMGRFGIPKALQPMIEKKIGSLIQDQLTGEQKKD